MEGKQYVNTAGKHLVGSPGNSNIGGNYTTE